MSDDAIIEGKQEPPQDMPALVCPYSGKRARPRGYVPGTGENMIKYAADDEDSFIVPVSSVSKVKDSKLDFSSMARRVLRFFEKSV